MNQNFDPITLLLPLMALGLAPFVAIMVSSFVKLAVVFALLRNALGIQQVPPNIVLNSMAVIFTAFVMYPIGGQVADALQARNLNSQMKTADLFAVVAEAREPLREFLIRNGKERERKFFHRTAMKIWPQERTKDLTDRDMIIAIPSFVLSELTEAFQIGFVLFLCFVAVDLILANILLAMGMSMVSPTVVSVPFKLLLFTLLDGWSVLIHSLVQGYR